MKRKAREEVLRRALEGGLIDDLVERAHSADLKPAEVGSEVAARIRSLFGERDPRVPLTSERVFLRRRADVLVERGQRFAFVNVAGFRGFEGVASMRSCSDSSTDLFVTAEWLRGRCRWPSEINAEREESKKAKKERRRRNAR